MKTFRELMAEAVTGSAAKAKMVNIGTAKWPLHAKASTKMKTAHPDGSTHHVGGFVPPDYPAGGGSTKGDVVIHHNNDTYSHTGKTGTNVKTGEKSYEYKSSGPNDDEDKRLWVSKSGHAKED